MKKKTSEALKRAASVLRTARQYFPKSIRNHNRFALELVIAEINAAIYEEGGIDPMPTAYADGYIKERIK